MAFAGRLTRWGAAPSEAVPATNRRPPKPARARISAGRGRLVTQAVRLLLHFPELAARVADHKQSGLVELDLDFMLTSERVWGCFPNVPKLNIYECLRDPAEPGIATLHFTWDGKRRRLNGV